MRSLLNTFVAGLALVSQVTGAYLPRDIDEQTIEAISGGLAKRAAEPILNKVNTDVGLNVPVLYVGYVDTAGNYERVQCESATKGLPAPQTGRLEASEKRIITKGLTSCVSFMLVSSEGVLKAHVPPHLCDVMQYTNHRQVPTGREAQYAQLKNIRKGLALVIKNHPHLKNGQLLQVEGPNSQAARTAQLRSLFGGQLPVAQSQLKNPRGGYTDAHGTTVVDMTTRPFKYYAGGEVLDY